MEYDLLCHSYTPMPSIRSIRVRAERLSGRRLALNYAVDGDISKIVMPIIMQQERADDLWRTTCFELFLTDGYGTYLELNFSPSSRWAAYVFEGYRTGQRITERISVSRLDIKVSANTLTLGVVVDLTRAISERFDLPWLTGFSAIIEEHDRSKSYWALVHPPGMPDFHHRDCFAAILEAPASE